MNSSIQKIIFFFCLFSFLSNKSQTIIQESIERFKPSKNEYYFMAANFFEYNSKDELVKITTFRNGYLTGNERTVDSLFINHSYYKYSSNKDTLFRYYSGNSVSWRLEKIKVTKKDTLRITDLYCGNGTIYVDSIIITNNKNEAVEIYYKEFGGNQKYNTGISIKEYFKCDAGTVKNYNQMYYIKQNTAEFSYLYEDKELKQVIEFDSPNIPYSKKSYKKTKKYNYSKELKKARQLYIAEKNNR